MEFSQMDGEQRIRLFLLAHNRLLREALLRILAKKEDIEVVGSCPFSSKALTTIVEVAPDVLVMDSFATDEVAQIEFVREIKRRLPDVKIIMIDMESDVHHFLNVVREGAMGYLMKDASALDVVEAVRAVARGGASCSAELCAFLFRYAAKQNQLPNFYARNPLGFTTREQQLVSFIARGYTNKEIASQLQLAEQTVRNHIHRMLKKLGVPHRLAVVDICRMQGIPA
jgi:DNA-binding NarL/FixJ family response regulator